MRLTLPILRRLSEALRKRDWFGVGFELFVVVLGVVLGLEATGWAAAREERQYRAQILASLDRTLGDYEYEGGRIHDLIETNLNAFARSRETGERPAPPVIIFPGMERPPTRAWEALVDTGVARSIDPDLMFRLALHFDRADSWGDKYQRYNQITEEYVRPFRGNPAHFYGPDGELKPIFASHMELLRDLLALNDQMKADASSLRRRLKAPRVEDADGIHQDLPLEG